MLIAIMKQFYYELEQSLLNEKYSKFRIRMVKINTTYGRRKLFNKITQENREVMLKEKKISL